MLENTTKNKAKFVAPYWGQKVLRSKDKDFPELSSFSCTVNACFMDILNENNYLYLKPLSKISDEDALVAMSIFGVANTEFGFITQFSPINKIKKVLIESDVLPANVHEHLTQQGYAMDRNNLPVEKQLEYGWVVMEEE